MKADVKSWIEDGRLQVHVDLKGDLPGHPFRGNQWSGGGVGSSVIDGLDVESGTWGQAIGERVRMDVDTGYPESGKMPKSVQKLVEFWESRENANAGGQQYKQNIIPVNDRKLTSEELSKIDDGKGRKNRTSVDIDDLETRQSWIDPRKLVRMTQNVSGDGDRPTVMRLDNGKFLLLDGNHRAVLDIQMGKKQIEVDEYI